MKKIVLVSLLTLEIEFKTGHWVGPAQPAYLATWLKRLTSTVTRAPARAAKVPHLATAPMAIELEPSTACGSAVAMPSLLSMARSRSSNQLGLKIYRVWFSIRLGLGIYGVRVRDI